MNGRRTSPVERGAWIARCQAHAARFTLTHYRLPGALDSYRSVNTAAESFRSMLKTEFYSRRSWPTKTKTARAGRWPGLKNATTGSDAKSSIDMIIRVGFKAIHT